MKKYILTLIALVGITTVVHANSYNSSTLFQNLNCYNSSYNCGIDIGQGQQVSDCTFTFTSCNTKYGYLSCDLDGVGIDCHVGSQNGSCTTWTCTLDSQQVDCLNQCLDTGKCDFQIQCEGDWNIGCCNFNYDCHQPPPCQNVPDGATTVLLLAAVLAAMEIYRRMMATAKLAVAKK